MRISDLGGFDSPVADFLRRHHNKSLARYPTVVSIELSRIAVLSLDIKNIRVVMSRRKEQVVGNHPQHMSKPNRL
jgi:hypothetical protein